jgi:hypothetical protein
MNWKVLGGRGHGMYYPSIFTERLRKASANLNQDRTQIENVLLEPEEEGTDTCRKLHNEKLYNLYLK